MNSSRDPLSVILSGWRVAPPANPDFRPAVWRRIGALRSRESWPAYLRAHAALWTLMAAVVLSAAGWTGHAAAQARMRADREAIVASYLVDLDPRVQASLKP
ncbi:MAG: hypothetical protein PHQ04_06285 [Opitutaceae bacterium]|nr:hypothetical protein [Opitutaceae bacterium]